MKFSLANFFLMIFLTLLLSSCGVLNYQGVQSELGPFKLERSFSADVVGPTLALAANGSTLLSEDWRTQVIYRFQAGVWQETKRLDNRPDSGPADDTGTPWFRPQVSADGGTVISSAEDTLRQLTWSSSNWQSKAILDSESLFRASILMSSDARILTLCCFENSDGFSIWENQNGTWQQLASINELNAFGEPISPVALSATGNIILTDSAELYERTGNTWQKKSTVTTSTFVQPQALTATGTRVAVEDESFKVKLFDFNGSSWQPRFSTEGQFKALSTDGKTLVVQKFKDTGQDFIGTPQSQGYLEIYEETVSGWQKIATLAPNSDRNSFQQVSLSDNGSVLAVSFQDPPFSSSIRIQVFKK